MNRLPNLWAHLNGWLFQYVEEPLGPLTAKQRTFSVICELAQPDKCISKYRGHRLGRRKLPRLDFAKAYLLKAYLGLPSTKMLRELLIADRTWRCLCGWDHGEQVPSESTFSRAFQEFADTDLGERLHETMIKAHCGDRLVGHLSRDSSAIPTREKVVKKTKPDKPKRKRGRPRRDEKREPPEPKRLQLQAGRRLEENLADLPTACDWAVKKNSQGKRESWKGYSIHLDCADGGIPISAIVTSASVHDSQVAIPLAQKSAQRVTNLYDLMDAGYDAVAIRDYSISLGHVPIIDRNARGKQVAPMAPAQARRYRERSTVERLNSDLKDNHGGRHVRVRGHAKVRLHLMCGVIVIAAMQLIRLLE